MPTTTQATTIDLRICHTCGGYLLSKLHQEHCADGPSEERLFVGVDPADGPDATGVVLARRTADGLEVLAADRIAYVQNGRAVPMRDVLLEDLRADVRSRPNTKDGRLALAEIQRRGFAS